MTNLLNNEKKAFFGCNICKNRLIYSEFRIWFSGLDKNELFERLTQNEINTFVKSDIKNLGYYYCINTECENHQKIYIDFETDEEMKKIISKFINRQLFTEILKDNSEFPNIEEERELKKREDNKRRFINVILDEGDWVKTTGNKNKCHECGKEIEYQSIVFVLHSHHSRYIENYYLCEEHAKSKKDKPSYLKLKEKEERSRDKQQYLLKYKNELLKIRNLQKPKFTDSDLISLNYFTESDLILLNFIKKMEFTDRFGLQLKENFEESWNNLLRRCNG